MELMCVRRAVVVDKMSEREAARQVWAGSRDGAEDAALHGAAGLPGPKIPKAKGAALHLLRHTHTSVLLATGVTLAAVSA